MQVALTDLPSKGFVYDVPLSNILIRPMLGGDEKLLSELSVENIETKYLALLRNRVKGGDPLIKGIDPAKLTLGDRLYILLWERINSYSPKFKTGLICQNCFKEINIELDLTKIEEKTLPDGFKEPQELTLSGGEKVSLRLFRIEDEINSYEKEKKEGIEKTYLYRLALSIVDTKSIEDRISFLESLPGKDIAKIKFFHESHVHGPQLEKIPYECPKCQEVGSCALPFRATLLIPAGSEIN